MVNWLVVIFWTLIILWIAYSIWSSARYASRAGGRGGGPIFLPGPGWGSGSGGSGWSGGGGRRRRLLRRRRQFRRRRSLGRMVRPRIQPFTSQDEADIAEAITRAEAQTSGEIVVVVAIASDGYRSFGLLWAALIALAVPMPLIFATKWAVEYIYLLQLWCSSSSSCCSSWRASVTRWCPNPSRARAHQRAVEQFIVQNLHTTKGRTGVLIYVSFAERFAEVIADEGIYKKVPTSTWEDVVGELTNHLARGTTPRASSAPWSAAARFSPSISRPAGRPNELPNHLIVLDAYGRPYAEAGQATAPTGKRALIGWVLFDWATQPFYTLVVTFLFAPYFVNGFMGRSGAGGRRCGPMPPAAPRSQRSKVCAGIRHRRSSRGPAREALQPARRRRWHRPTAWRQARGLE